MSDYEAAGNTAVRANSAPAAAKLAMAAGKVMKLGKCIFKPYWTTSSAWSAPADLIA